jgi:hypothetical protein
MRTAFRAADLSRYSTKGVQKNMIVRMHVASKRFKKYSINFSKIYKPHHNSEAGIVTIVS